MGLDVQKTLGWFSFKWSSKITDVGAVAALGTYNRGGKYWY